MGCTLKDIACEAGVSTASVSLVLNHKNCRIAEETRKSILKIAARNHYTPNASARALVMRHSQTLGLIVPDISNSYFSELAKGVEREAQKLGYSVIFCSSDAYAKKDLVNFKLLSARQIDGLILVPSIGDQDDDYAIEFNALAADYRIPIVQFDRKINGGNYDTVSIDHKLGGYMATNFLIERGYRKIGCVTGTLNVASGKARYDGYLDALLEHDLPLDNQLTVNGDFTFDSGKELAPILLDKNVDAIFACNDQMAFGTIRAMRQRHMKPGRDIALIGFDNSPMCDIIDVPLTTIAQPVYEMGKSACNMLIQTINGGQDPNVRQTLNFAPTLVIRDTTPQKEGPLS